MEWMKNVLGLHPSKHRICPQPENLPGVKKASFSLPYRGGEIWFEHLDGMYQHTELALKKLHGDSAAFLSPSAPSQIGFVLTETLITPELADAITKLLCEGPKKFTRVCFIGADRKAQRLLRQALNQQSRFAFSFIHDFELAKERLIPG